MMRRYISKHINATSSILVDRSSLESLSSIVNECDLFLQTNLGEIYSYFLVQKMISDFYSSVNNECWRRQCL